MFSAFQWNCFNLVDTCNIALILFLKCDVTKFRIPPRACHTMSHFLNPSTPLNVWRNLWIPPLHVDILFQISFYYSIIKCICVIFYRILPCLMKEFVNPTMVPFVLPNVLLVSENCSKEEFSQHILPHLRPVMKMQDPIQVTYSVLCD